MQNRFENKFDRTAKKYKTSLHTITKNTTFDYENAQSFKNHDFLVSFTKRNVEGACVIQKTPKDMERNLQFFRGFTSKDNEKP